MRDSLHAFDTYWIHAITSLPVGLDGFMASVSFLGGPAITIPIIALITLYGLRYSRPLAYAGVIAGLVFALNGMIKIIVHRDRPMSADVLNLVSSSFPSGHTAGSTLAYGVLAILLWSLLPRKYALIGAGLIGLLVVLVGISRVYLGAHYPSDVVAGWLLGVIGIGCMVWIKGMKK